MIDLDTALRLVGMRLGDRALIGPQVVQLDLTDACTNNCVGCWARSPFLRDEDHYDTLKKGALDLAFVRHLMPALSELRVKELFLGGGGDPLCHPDLHEVIRLAKQANLHVTLNTNFTLADRALIDKLIEAGLDLLVVSLWAATGETYSRLHPNKTEATFRVLTENLRYLGKCKAARPGPPRVKLYQVINKANLEELPAMIEHGRQVGAEEVELAIFDPIPGRTNIFTLDRRRIDRALALVEQIDKEGPPFVHTELFVRRLQNIDATKGVFDNGIVGSIPCAAGWFYSRITTVGEVHSCLKAHRIPVGDLTQHDIRAVWFGDGMKTFRQHTQHLNYNDPWLQNIGHDIDFALPGCFRICDNIGHNQHIMKLNGGLNDSEKRMLDEMEKTARAGAELVEVENVYRKHHDGRSEPVKPFSPPVDVDIKTEAGFVLHGDNEFVHELADSNPWVNTVHKLDTLADSDAIRIPITIANIARLDRTLALIRNRTGRAVDPAWTMLDPRPLSEIHRRWPNKLQQAREQCAKHRVMLDLNEQIWRDALWRFASAARPDREAELLRALGALTGKAFVGPRTFHLDVTNACPADCAYCWFHSPLAQARTDPHRLTDANRDATMPWEMFERLADDLVALEAKEDIVLSGKGEPLVHPRIVDMIGALKTRGLAVTLFTGGERLDDAVARACVESGLDMLYVSLSAATPKTFARLHTALPAEAHGRIVANVKHLLDLRKAAKSELPRVVLVDVITNRNDHEVEDFARLAAQLGVDHVRYQLAAIESYNGELALSPTRMRMLPEGLALARTIAEQAGVAVVENIDFQVGGHGEGADWSGERYRELGCFAGFVFGRAWADGMLSFCCAPRPIGNLAERSFAEWWRSDEYDRARLAARSLGKHLDYPFTDGTTLWTDVCRRCPNYEGIERLRDVLTEVRCLDLLP